MCVCVFAFLRSDTVAGTGTWDEVWVMGVMVVQEGGASHYVEGVLSHLFCPQIAWTGREGGGSTSGKRF